MYGFWRILYGTFRWRKRKSCTFTYQMGPPRAKPAHECLRAKFLSRIGRWIYMRGMPRKNSSCGLVGLVGVLGASQRSPPALPLRSCFTFAHKRSWVGGISGGVFRPKAGFLALSLALPLSRCWYLCTSGGRWAVVAGVGCGRWAAGVWGVVGAGPSGRQALRYPFRSPRPGPQSGPASAAHGARPGKGGPHPLVRSTPVGELDLVIFGRRAGAKTSRRVSPSP